MPDILSTSRNGVAEPGAAIKPAPVAGPPRPADLKAEYVSSGYLTWYANFLRSTPEYIDDVTRDFGLALYRRMMYDPQVSSSVNTIKQGILARPLRLPAAVGRKDPQYDKACAIADHLTRTFAALDTPLLDALWNILDALAYGHKVAEKVYAVQQGGPDGGKLVLKKLKVRPLETTAFVLDAYNNVVGLLAIIPGVAYPLQINTILADPDQVPNLLPRDKFAVLTVRPEDGDPRGQSLLRPAYNAWWLKQQLWPEYLKYLTQFASPIPYGTTPENAIAQPLLDATGAQVLDAYGKTVEVTPEQAMLSTMVQMRNGSAMAFPFGSKFDVVTMQGEGGAFLAAFDLYNREMEKAITGQTLATGEAKQGLGSGNAAGVHQDILGGVMTYGRTILETMLYRDLCLPQVVMNFGEEWAHLCPTPQLTDTEAQDQGALWTAAAALKTASYFSPSQYVELDGMLGLPARDEDEVADMAAQQQASLAALQAPRNGPQAPAPAPDGGTAPQGPQNPADGPSSGKTGQG